MAKERFAIQIPDGVLADLKYRLESTRWPDEIEQAGWDYGANLSSIRSLADYWRQQYDWRSQEAALNRWPHYLMSLDGYRVHFLHVRGKGAAPLPLIITHGWPGSFVEMLKIVPLLTDPEAHGGRAEDAFDVVVPSLPGFGFSDRPRQGGMDPQRIAELWTRLMHNLGYERFGAQGGDWGSTVSIALGLEHAPRMIGVHLNYIAGRFLFGGTLNDSPADEASRTYLAKLRAWFDIEGGYSHQQGTRPQTLAYGLNDSPVGLAAWIVEKFNAWSDCDGNAENIFTRDELLTNVMIYWVTQTIASSTRLYYESRLRPLSLSPTHRVTPPVGVAVFPKEIPLPPRAVAERGLNIVRWTEMPEGGHFAALEQPERLAQDVREFFRPLR